MANRLQDEIALIDAMYPGQVAWTDKSRELKFSTTIDSDANTTATSSGVLVVRVPDDYLTDDGSLPTVIVAQGSTKQDHRQSMVEVCQDLHLVRGQEVLDQIVSAFDNLVSEERSALAAAEQKKHSPESDGRSVACGHAYKTVIIWLHHLLATGKRKLALNPSLTSSGLSSAQPVSGLTKPGYPGIMIFSGPAELVESHVNELKNQRWQAFQIRFEERHDPGAQWAFEHGSGIQEVESMSEVVSSIGDQNNREAFLKAAGVK